MDKKTVIQLFNAGSARGSRRLASDGVARNAFQSHGLEVEVWTPHRWPWNPFAKMHNAYCGLDPLRALKVLLTARKADLICAHLESSFLILLLRRLFCFRVRVLIWEMPWSPGWRFRETVARLALPRAEGCVVFGRNQIHLIHREYGNEVRVFFQLFHTDTELYSPRPGTSSARKIVWSCGLDAGRDFSVLLEASKHVDALFRIKAARLHAPAMNF